MTWPNVSASFRSLQAHGASMLMSVHCMPLAVTGDCASGDFCGPSRTLIAVERPPQAATVAIAPMHTTPTDVQSLH